MHAPTWLAGTASVLCLLASTPACLHGQGSPQSLHWGAIALPELDSYWEIGITLDRFTTTHKEGDDRDTIPWAIDENLGLNSLVIGRTLPLWGRAGTVRVHGQIGYTNDDPTAWLQNEFLHYFNDLEPVPDTVAARSSLDAALGLELNGFVDIHPSPWDWIDLNMPIFGGIGGIGGTAYSEIYVQAGIHSQSWRIFNCTAPTLSYLFRAGLYVEGTEAFPEGTLNNSHRTHQVVLAVPIDRWWDGPASLPTIRVGLTRSSGIFMRRGTDELEPETFCSVQFEWMDGDFTVETYNDTCGGKDTGPSYGVRVWIRWRDSFGDSRQGI